jgi:PAS domain-containing protein
MIPSIDRTLFLTRPTWENPRDHLLDDVWLLTIVAVLVATGLPWFANDFEVDLGTASIGLLALGAMHVAFTLLGTSTTVNARWHNRALTLLHVTGVLLLGFIWRHVGALQNPLFLLVFALPVIGAIFLSRWQPYVVAVASIAVVGGVALSQAPELRWYASALLGNDASFMSLFGHPSTVAPASFSGFYAPSSYLLVLLEVFAVLLIACAVAAEYVGLIVERLNGYTLVARGEAQRGQELWASLIEQLPVPALLVEPATLTVVSVSAAAVGFLGGGELPLEGRPLFEILQCTYPDAVQALLKGADGEAPMNVIRFADELRLTRVRVLHVAHKGQRLALLTVEDVTGTFCLKAALDTSEYAALVIDSRGRVMVYNERAAGLFGMTGSGVAAAQLLPPTDAGLAWWEPGLTGRRKLHVEIGTRVYQITSSAVRFPGETEPLFTVSILPVAEGTPSDTRGTDATTIINARQLR